MFVALSLVSLSGCTETLFSIFVAAGVVERGVANDRERDRLTAPCNVRACPANQHCNHLYTPPRCASTLSPLGEPCGLSPIDNQTFFQCESQLQCVGPATGPHRCVAAARDGEPCAPLGMELPQCADGLRCGDDRRCHPR